MNNTFHENVVAGLRNNSRFCLVKLLCVIGTDESCCSALQDAVGVRGVEFLLW